MTVFFLQPLEDQLSSVGLGVIATRQFQFSRNVLVSLQEGIGTGGVYPEYVTLRVGLPKSKSTFDSDLGFADIELVYTVCIK